MKEKTDSSKETLGEKYLAVLESLRQGGKSSSVLSLSFDLTKPLVAARLAALVRWGCIRESKPGFYELTDLGSEALRTGMKPKAEAGRMGRRIVGPRSQIPDLVYEPINEQGVIFLFAKYHRELGIEYIESIQQGFPDAFGRRKIGKVGYEPVNIEFEFKSLDFKNHQHDLKECDIIVCWEHNWKECPLEVIELKTAIMKGK